MASIIFDFDGTIADSFDYVVGFFVEQSGKPLNPDKKQSLRGLSMKEIAEEMGFKWWQAPKLYLHGRSKMTHQIKNIKPIDGMVEVIQKLHSEGHELFIVSANSAKNIERFLDHHGLRQYFVDVYGGAGFFGKVSVLRKLFKAQSLEIKESWHIGDELRDIQASQSLGLRIIAVTWGFARQSTLFEARPTAIAHKPEEIITILEEN